MKCFNHPAGDAVAICKACGKSVCAQCLVESGHGVACRQNCSEILSEKNELYTLQAAHLKNSKRMNVLGSFFSIGMGILFIYFSSQGLGVVYDFIFLMGAGFAVYGFMVLLVNIIIYFKSKRTKLL